MRTILAGLLLATALLIAVPAAATPTPVWLGTWDTNWGPLTIGAGEGAFGSADSWNTPLGHIRDLKTDGATLSGSWSHDAPSHFAPRDHGTFTLHMTVGARVTFAGTVLYAYDGQTIEWTGTCQAGGCAADTVAPKVKALTARAKPGALVSLRWQASDEGGQTTDVLSVWRGSTRLWTARTTHAVSPGRIYSMSYRAPKTRGTLRFTVESTDKSGNRANSSASITVR